MLSFESYFYLCERHNNVSNEVNNNVKHVRKLLVQDFKNKLKTKIENTFVNVKTDYDYLIGGFKLYSEYANNKLHDSILIFDKNVKIKIKNHQFSLPIKIVISTDSDSIISGGFSTDNNEQDPEIIVYLDALEIQELSFSKCRAIIIDLIKTLSHEIMHSYQYISRKNYTRGESKESTIPTGFSYLIYYTKQSEIEAVLSSAYSLHKAKKQNIDFFNALLRTIDFAISDVDNEISNSKLTPQYLKEKYIKHNQYNCLFLLNYVLSYGLKNSRYYSLVSNNENYKKYIQELNVKETVKIKNILEEIYNVLEKRFLETDYKTEVAYSLLRNRNVLKNILTSSTEAQNLLDKITNNDFDNTETAYDEEEDDIVYGRPDLDEN